MLRGALIIALTGCSLVAFAQVYKHVDEDGNVTFTDQPPAGAELIEIRPTNTLAPPPRIEYNTAEATAPPVRPTAYALKITSPADETIIPRGPGNFSVSANISPRLGSGSKLQLLIDGVAEGEPQKGSSWSLTNVYRGTHRLEVAVVDTRGKQLAKSEAVTVYVFRPSSNF